MIITGLGKHTRLQALGCAWASRKVGTSRGVCKCAYACVKVINAHAVVQLHFLK